jgi:hypothetical protein
MIFDIETTINGEDCILMYDEQKCQWVKVNISLDPIEQKKKEREKKLKRILNEL